MIRVRLRASRRAPCAGRVCKVVERCSDGVGDQGAEEEELGPSESCYVRFASRLPCERRSFQRDSRPQTWNVDGVGRAHL